MLDRALGKRFGCYPAGTEICVKKDPPRAGLFYYGAVTLKINPVIDPLNAINCGKKKKTCVSPST